MKKRVLSLLLALLMLLSLMPVGALADGAASGSTTVSGVTYTLDNGVLTVSGAGECGSNWMDTFDTAAVTSVVIKSGITGIAYGAFYDCESLASVTIPSSVRSIGGYAFEYCTGLTEVVIPAGVETIGTGAFESCSGLTSIYIGSSVKEVGDYTSNYGDVFDGCDKLTSINVAPENQYYTSYEGVLFNSNMTVLRRYPGGKSGSYRVPGAVEIIGSVAFSNCDKLTSVSIPNSVTHILENSFSSCDSLLRIDVDSDNTAYSSSEGVLYNRSQSTLIQYPGAKKGSFMIPSTVSSVHNYAFVDCIGLTSVTIPESVKWIGDEVFNGSYNLETISVSASHPKYSSRGGIWYNKDFSTMIKCPEGKTGELVIPNGVKSADDALDNCKKLTSIVIGDSITDLRDFKFCTNTGLETVVIGKGITEIPGAVWQTYAFKDCTNLKKVVIGENVESISDHAFEGCTGLQELTIPDSVTSIGYNVFDDCAALKSVTVGNGLTDLRWIDFTNCPELEYLDIGDGITDIDLGDCEKLKNLVIGSGVSSLNYKWNLWSCTALESITVSEGNQNYSSLDGVLYNKDKTELLYIPSTRTGAFTVPGSVECLDYSFGTSSRLTEIIISDGVKEIAGEIFRDNENLKKVVIPDSVTKIGDHAFMDCTNLTDISMGTGVTELGWGVFYGTGYYNDRSYWENDLLYLSNWLIHSDYYAQTLEVKDGINYIAPFSFNGDDIKNLILPDSIVKISEFAFQICPNLTDVYYAGTQQQWEAVAIEEGNYGITGVQKSPALGYYEDHAPATIHYGYVPHEHSYTATEIIKPTCTEDGYSKLSCTHCGLTIEDNYVDALGHKYENGKCIRCGEADPNADKPTENPFTDVTSEKYFYAPVMWAVNHDPQITGGYTDGTFRPQNTCTRAQIVTFIWRAKGCPEPASNTCTFTDVAPGAYYYKAVLWAVENGITGGYNEYTFGSNDTVTRAQAMTFLWRAAGKPAAPAGTVNTFTDVGATSYYYNAVMWAVANGITGGYNAQTFGSNDGCTRGQIVTFLYRSMK